MNLMQQARQQGLLAVGTPQAATPQQADPLAAGGNLMQQARAMQSQAMPEAPITQAQPVSDIPVIPDQPVGEPVLLATSDPLGPTRGQRAGVVRATKQRNLKEQARAVMPALESGNISAQELDPELLDAVRLERIADIPEITGRFPELSENIQFGHALASMSAFDPREMAQIIKSADPNIGVAETPEGELIAVNNKTGAAFSLNKIGPSLMDAAQFAGTTAAYAPVAGLATIPAAIAGSMATQAGIEAGQAAAGGTFDTEDVLIAGAAVPVVAGVTRAVPASIAGLRQIARRGMTSARGRNIPPAPRPSLTPTPETPKPRLPSGFVEATPDRPIPTQTKTRIPGGFVEDIPEPTPPATQQESWSMSSWLFDHENATRKAIRESLEDNTRDDITAGYKLAVERGAQVVKKDPKQRAMLRQEWDPGVVAPVAGSSKADKTAMTEALDLLERGIKNKLFARSNRPDQVVGKTIMNRWRAVDRLKGQASKDIQKIAERDLKNQRFDVDDIASNFYDRLEREGVELLDDPDGPLFDFSASIWADDRKAQRFIEQGNKWIDELRSTPDAFRAHVIKRRIDGKVDYKIKPGQVVPKIDETAENVVKELRAGIKNKLSKDFEQYGEANRKFSEAVTELEKFAKASGSKFNPDAESAERFAGNLSRRLLSNVQSKEQLNDAIMGLERVASKYGEGFEDNVMIQLLFVDELERLFGSFAPTSFMGQIQKAIGKQITGDQISTADLIATEAMKKAMGKSEEKALRSARNLLRD